MAKLRNLLNKLINLVFPLEDALYFLQLEEYKTKRYIKHISKLLTRRNLQRRDKISNTSHIKILRNLTLLVYLAIISFVVTLAHFLNPIFGVGLLMLPLVSLILAFLNIITMPYYERLTLKNEQKAKALIESKFPNVKVVAVTGSFGKTTTKNFIFELVRHSYKTQMIPGNINTAIGIANWLIRNLDSGTELIVVEMGAYVTGEIERSCEILQPDISVITALSEQHMDRFKTFDNLIDAKLEIFRGAEANAVRLISSNFAALIADQYTNSYEVVNVDELKYKGEIVDTNLDSVSLKQNLSLALRVAEELDIKSEYVKHSLRELKLPDRRKDIKQIGGFTVIDDSYNISLETAKESIKYGIQRAKSENKDLVIITAGIPELGESNRDANIQLGEFIDRHKQKIMILESDLARDIRIGIKDRSLITNRQVILNMQSALTEIFNSTDPDKTIILMLPELNDLYY